MYTRQGIVIRSHIDIVPRKRAWTALTHLSTNITNYADGNTPRAIESNIEKLIEALENDINMLLRWFK